MKHLTLLTEQPYGTKVTRQGGYLGIEGSRQQAKMLLLSAHNHGDFEGVLGRIGEQFWTLAFTNPDAILSWLERAYRARFDVDRLESDRFIAHIKEKARRTLESWPTQKFIRTASVEGEGLRWTPAAAEMEE